MFAVEVYVLVGREATEGASMNAADEPSVTLPLSGTPHAHTGCSHVECPLPGGLVLWLLGSCAPRMDVGRPLFRAGQTLGGFVRPAGGASEKAQAEVERSGALDGLEVE